MLRTRTCSNWRYLVSGLNDLKRLCEDLTILYIEDDVTIRTSMHAYLIKLFQKVLVAYDGMEGLELYKTNKVDLIITDLSMPRMNGLDMLKEIKKINENQAVLITSAHSESEYMFGAIRLGVDGYIIKPFDYPQLNAELFKITNKLNKFKENEQYKLHLQDMVSVKTLEITKLMMFESNNYEQTLISMVEMIEERDTYTAGHSKRVAEYSKKIAQQMGYSEQECTKLYQAGILHDIGKVATPDTVLLNPKTLNAIEYKLIQEHVVVSYNLLKNIPMFKDLADIVRSHHERCDGKGYPRGLSGEEIEPLSRIMMVADAFDAMTTNRIYKPRKTVSEALSELVSLKLQQFHPEVVDSAVIALRDIKIDENISQTPKTKLEEERFAYFYKDTIGNIYNQNYLELILSKNSYEPEYKYMKLFTVHSFSQYNKKYGWKEGDIFLHSFAQSLVDYFKGALVFRVFGDDFVVMCKETIIVENLKPTLDALIKNTGIKYKIKSIDLSDVEINYISQIENA